MGKRADRGWRRWRFDEIVEVRRLRDEEGLTFPEIGGRMGATADQCRGVYHTGRKKPRLRVEDVCRRVGMSKTKFYAMKETLQDMEAPSGNEDVLMAFTGETRSDHD